MNKNPERPYNMDEIISKCLNPLEEDKNIDHNGIHNGRINNLQQLDSR